ncbi:MAG: methyltransferase domain-containing protein [Candidatus Falkowbacteria bacterium]
MLLKYSNRKHILIFGILTALFAVFLINPIASGLIGAILVIILLFSAYQEWALYALAFLIPVVNLYIPFSDFNIHALGFVKDFRIPIVDLFGLALLLGFIIKSIFRILNNKQENKKIIFPALTAFVIFFTATLLSAVNAYSWFASVWYVVRWILMFYAVYIVLPVNIITSKKILRNTIISFIFSAVVVSLMGVASVLQQDIYNEFVRFKPISIFGSYPIGHNQKQISEILVSAIALLPALFYWFKSAIAKKVLTAIYILFFIVLLGSFSRAAWLVLFLQLALLGIYYWHDVKQYISKWLVAVILVALFTLPLGFYMLSLQTSEVGLSSDQHRVLLTDIAQTGFVNHPLIGNGGGEYFRLQEKSIRYQATFASAMDAHGIWQKFMAEYGILGITTFCLFITSIAFYVYRAWQKITENIDYNLLAYTIIASFSIFVFEFFDTSFFRGKLWFIVGIMLATAKILCNLSDSIIVPSKVSQNYVKKVYNKDQQINISRLKQYQMEKTYAQRILRTTKGSTLRKQLIAKSNSEVSKFKDTYFMNEHQGGRNLTFAIIQKIAKPECSILDFGCGNGALVHQLRNIGYQSYGFDVSFYDVAVAQQPTIATIKPIIVNDIDALRDKKFDVIVMDNVIEHIMTDELSETLQTCYSLLKKGGLLYIATPHRFAGPHDISRYFLPLGSKAEGFHFHEFTVRDFVRILRTQPFSQIVSYAFHPALTMRFGFCPSLARIFIIKSVLLEKLFATWPLNYILHLNRSLTRVIIAICFPAIIIAKK